MKKILILLMIMSMSLFAEWKPIEQTNDFGDGTGEYTLFGVFENTENIRAIAFAKKNCAIVSSNNEFDWNYEDDIKLSIKRKSGKIESFRSIGIHQTGALFSQIDTNAIIKIFKEEKEVTIAVVTNDETYLTTLDLTGFSKLYSEYISK